MKDTNEITLIFDSRPVNEGLARITAASFCTQLNPTLEEVADLKTAVSEAVTNCIIHGYEGKIHKIEMQITTGRKRNPCGYHGSWSRNTGCRKGNGTYVYHEAGKRQIRYGIYFHGSFYG